MDRQHRNRRTALLASGIIVGMLALTAASVPLYDLFCRVTGFGGTTQVADTAPETIADRTIRISFNADRQPDLPWRFQPMQRSMEVRPGENHLAFYVAENRSDEPVVGRAVYNVTPHKVGGYFAKVHCFCFEEQLLQPGERVEMPVSFFVDPAMLDDVNTRDVVEITLSYTFFKDEDATAALAAADTALLAPSGANSRTAKSPTGGI
jgi:cytochrome c oxidase assembly protein subunit 11